MFCPLPRWVYLYSYSRYTSWQVYNSISIIYIMNLHINIISPFFTTLSLAGFELAQWGHMCPLPGALTIRPPDRVTWICTHVYVRCGKCSSKNSVNSFRCHQGIGGIRRSLFIGLFWLNMSLLIVPNCGLMLPDNGGNLLSSLRPFPVLYWELVFILRWSQREFSSTVLLLNLYVFTNPFT